jgi:hypothetical protein
MTQRPVQPAGSPDDAHITQIREPQPGTLGNMNWRQNESLCDETWGSPAGRAAAPAKPAL